MNISLWPRAKGAQDTALIVNSRRQDREAMKNLFCDADYHVLSADSGDEAMELCRNYRGAIHLLVTDVEGGTAGWDLAETAARIRPGLIVLFLSKETMGIGEQVPAAFNARLLLEVTQALGRRGQPSKQVH